MFPIDWEFCPLTPRKLKTPLDASFHVSMGREMFINSYANISMGRQMIKKDKEGMYVEVAGEKFYISNIDETVDDLISLINSLRQAEKLANKYEEDDELLIIIRKKIAYYCEVLREIYNTGDDD